MPKETYTITIHRPAGCSVELMKEHIMDLINSSSGCLDPMDERNGTECLRVTRQASTKE